MLITFKQYTELKNLDIPNLLKQHERVFEPYWTSWRLDQTLETDKNEMQVLHEKHRSELSEKLEKFKTVLAANNETEVSQIIANPGTEWYKWDWFVKEVQMVVLATGKLEGSCKF
jgi:Fe-S cluster biosynthesis and repair protein YggX